MTAHAGGAASRVPEGSPAQSSPLGRADQADETLMSIGEVLGHLRTEFPDATISKLRFLESEGLVEPRRTPAGYRKYTWDDVARLRYVLTAQRDHYLPLRVIRERLAGADTGTGPAVALVRPPLVAVGGQPRSSSGDTGPTRAAAEPVGAVTAPTGRFSRVDLLERSGVTESTLAALEQYGLIASRSGGWYDGDAVVIAEAVAELARFGLEPRHLRAWRAAADREVGLYAQLVTPLARQADPAARARAAEVANELVTLSQRLHGALIRVGLRDALGP